MRLIALLSVVSMSIAAVGMSPPATDGSGEPPIEFPYVLKIPSGSVLIVQGREFRDEVQFTWSLGESLRVEGFPIRPRRAAPRRVFSEQELAFAYGRVDYVRERIDSGYTWHQAVDAWYEKRDKEIQSARARYGAVLDSTGSPEKAAEAVSDSFDRSLLRPGYEPIVTLTSTSVQWQGAPFQHSVHLPEPTGELPEIDEPELKEWFRKKTEEEYAKLEARSLAHWFDWRIGAQRVVIESSRGRIIFSGEEARRAMAQIEDAKRGNIKEGPVDETELRRIMNIETSE